MNVSLYQAAAAMNASARWQDLIAENLAVAASPAARKRDIVFSAVAAGLNQTGATIPAASTAINFQPGTLRPTGAPLDFAIEGKGFFEVEMPDGSYGYTRDGQFRLDAQGQLITSQGFPVLGEGGPIRVNPANNAPLSIAPTGEVTQGEEVKGKLHLVEFSNPQKLTQISSGFFLANDPAAGVTDSSTSRVQQGFLEGSNTSPTVEMATLITAMRMFEANQKVLQMQDDRAGRAITDLGSPS